MGLLDVGRRLDQAVIAAPVRTVTPPPWQPSLGPVRPAVPDDVERARWPWLVVAAAAAGVVVGVLRLTLGPLSTEMLFTWVLLPALSTSQAVVQTTATADRLAVGRAPRTAPVEPRPQRFSLLLAGALLYGLVAGPLTVLPGLALLRLLRARVARLERVEAAHGGRLVRLVRARGPARDTSRTYLMTG